MNVAEHGAAEPSEKLPAPLAAMLALVATLLALLAIFGPHNLLANDQEKPSGYVADILHNGSWIVQRDQTGDIASKPPLQVWLATLSVMAAGRDSDGLLQEWALRLPSLLAVMATGWTIWLATRPRLGTAAAAAAVLALWTSMPALRMVGLVRTDPLLMLLVAASAFGVFHAWHGSRRFGTLVFCLSLAVLTKGPVGLILALLGLLAFVLPSRLNPGEMPPARRLPATMPLLIGGSALAAAAIGSAWFALALAVEGRDVWDKLIGRELVGHALHKDTGGPLSPWLFLLPRFAPWSVLGTGAALWVLARPGADPLLRFCAAWFFGGMALFMAGSHHRMDHLYPLLPALAVLCGWAGAQLWNAGGKPKWLILGVCAVAAAMFSASLMDRVFLTGSVEERSTAARTLAREILARTPPGTEPAFIAHHSPQATQFHLGINRREIDTAPVVSMLLRTSQTLVASRGRGPGAERLGLDAAGDLALLWGADLGDPKQEHDMDDGNAWNLGLVTANTSSRSAKDGYAGVRAIQAGATTSPLMLGPAEVVRANRHVLVLKTGGLSVDDVFPDGQPKVEVVHAEDWAGPRYPALPLSRPVAAVLFLAVVTAIIGAAASVSRSDATFDANPEA